MSKDSNRALFGGGGQTSLSSFSGVEPSNNGYRIIRDIARVISRSIRQPQLTPVKSASWIVGGSTFSTKLSPGRVSLRSLLPKSAFTLAEVLITLGIIGVVAAMTLPGLIVKTKEKENVTRLKKVHVTLESAFRLAENEHSEIVNWFDIVNTKTNSEIFYKNLKPYLKVIKDCGYTEGCFHDGYVKTLDGRNYNKYNSNVNEYKVVLADGAAIMFYLSNPSCTETWNACGNIKVDFSTKNGDYTMGKDFFIFDITRKGIVPAGLQRDEAYPFEDYCNISKSTDANGRSCAGWVIYNENMDYLHCNDLSWSGKTKCK